MNNSSIYQTFDKEMKNYQPSIHDSVRLIPVSSTLPSWMGNIACKQQDSIFVLGISDPGLPDSTAKLQALQRACAMAALAQGTSGRFFSDSYLKSRNESSDSKFEEIYYFGSSCPNSLKKVRIVNDTILKSKERILFVAVPSISGSDPQEEILKFDGYMYNYEFEVDLHNRLLRKIEATISEKGVNEPEWEPDSLSFYQINQRFTGIKNYKQKFVPDYNRFEYFYTSEKSDSSQLDCLEKNPGSTCKTGLWVAFLNQVFDQLSYFIKANTKQIQLVSDQTPESRTELNREKELLMLKFNFLNVDLTDNKLIVQIKVSHEK